MSERYPIAPWAPLSHITIMMLTHDALEAAGIRTLGEIAACSASELLRLPGFGRKSLQDVKFELARGGMRLRDGRRGLAA